MHGYLESKPRIGSAERKDVYFVDHDTPYIGLQYTARSVIGGFFRPRSFAQFLVGVLCQ